MIVNYEHPDNDLSIMRVNTFHSLFLVIVVFSSSLVGTASAERYPSSPLHSLTNELLDSLSDLNYTLADLNASAPHLVKLLNSVDHYMAKYAARDLDKILPNIEFLLNIWLPAEVSISLSKLNSFVTHKMSPEFNLVRSYVTNYLYSDTINDDLNLVLDELDNFINHELPFELQRYAGVLNMYYEVYASTELKTLVKEVISYSNTHFKEEVRVLDRDLNSAVKHTINKQYFGGVGHIDPYGRMNSRPGQYAGFTHPHRNAY